MKIVQIAPVVEYRWSGSEDHGTHRIDPNEEATVYGLGDDGKLYVWAVLKSTRVEHKTEEELEAHDYDKYHYEKEYGWKEVA